MREFRSEAMRAALPRPEAHLVVRFGPQVPNGMDVGVMGARERVHRKRIPAGASVVMARIPLGMTSHVLGVSAAELAGRVVTLDELWGPAGRELCARLVGATPGEAAALLDRMIASRLTSERSVVLVAADRLAHASVRDVADELGISERQLRRVFREAVGVSPKSFARLVRFHRAVDAARGGASWARIAAASGYCDQAHLIDEFRAIAGTTPRQLMAELVDSMA